MKWEACLRSDDGNFGALSEFITELATKLYVAKNLSKKPHSRKTRIWNEAAYDSVIEPLLNNS